MFFLPVKCKLLYNKTVFYINNDIIFIVNKIYVYLYAKIWYDNIKSGGLL